MADQLLALYAQRKTAPGFAFPPTETCSANLKTPSSSTKPRDQNTAIDDIKRDMESAAPMDRLLCGDVGYGKTEVAMRAAFKAVGDGKQVAVLAPTTVLAFQHFETFKHRFAAFPVRIEMLSRFRSAAEQKKSSAISKPGKVDIVIGTHRLLSKDVKFQRPRPARRRRRAALRRRAQRAPQRTQQERRRPHHVRHAHPAHAAHVPRRPSRHVPHRDAPGDRLAIQTVVAPFQRRAGPARHRDRTRPRRPGLLHSQPHRVHLLRSPRLVSKLVPKARVVVGHGQMGENELEAVMLKFIRDEADVIVSTTIVENGLDIPRANTMLINRADSLGLAELYQLRGRVGRSSQRAYAYLLVPPEEIALRHRAQAPRRA